MERQFSGIEIRRETKPLAVAGITVCGVVASAFLGGTTNAVNAFVSPTYFVTVLGLWNGEDVWRVSVAQGLFEGIMFGIFFSLLFSVVGALITSASCPFGFALKHLVWIVAGSYVCWVLGGLAGIGLAALSPEFYQRTFFGVPRDFREMLRFAWVGGSIWGAQFGGFVCVVVGLVLLRANWRNQIHHRSMSEPEAIAATSNETVSTHFRSR